MEEHARERLRHIADFYSQKFAIRLDRAGRQLWSAPDAILAHGLGEEPRIVYANAAALKMFRMTAREMIGMPSSQSAEPDKREMRAQMLAQLEEKDFVSDYSGVRVAADGTRFQIENAVIFNIRDREGNRLGQAAIIPKWKLLEE